MNKKFENTGIIETAKSKIDNSLDKVGFLIENDSVAETAMETDSLLKEAGMMSKEQVSTDLNNDGEADSPAEQLVHELKSEKALHLGEFKRNAKSAENSLAYYIQHEDFLQKQSLALLSRIRSLSLNLPNEISEMFFSETAGEKDLLAYEKRILNLEKGFAFVKIIEQVSVDYKINDSDVFTVLFLLLERKANDYNRVGSTEKNDLKKIVLLYLDKHSLFENKDEKMGEKIDKHIEEKNAAKLEETAEGKEESVELINILPQGKTEEKPELSEEEKRKVFLENNEVLLEDFFIAHGKLKIRFEKLETFKKELFKEINLKNLLLDGFFEKDILEDLREDNREALINYFAKNHRKNSKAKKARIKWVKSFITAKINLFKSLKYKLNEEEPERLEGPEKSEEVEKPVELINTLAEETEKKKKDKDKAKEEADLPDLKEAEKKINFEKEKTDKINAVKSFDELYQVIDEIAPLSGSQGIYEYQAEELKEKVKEAISLESRKDFSYLTSSFGLRDKAIELYSKEIIPRIKDIRDLKTAITSVVAEYDQTDVFNAMLEIEKAVKKGDFDINFEDRYGIIKRTKELYKLQEEKTKKQDSEKLGPTGRVLSEEQIVKIKEREEAKKIRSATKKAGIKPTVKKEEKKIEKKKRPASKKETTVENLTAEIKKKEVKEQALSAAELLKKAETERRNEFTENYRDFLASYKGELFEIKSKIVLAEQRMAEIKSENIDLERLDTDEKYLKEYGDLCRELVGICVELDKLDLEEKRFAVLSEKYEYRLSVIEKNTGEIKDVEKQWLNEMSEGIDKLNYTSVVIADKVHDVTLEKTDSDLRVSFDNDLTRAIAEEWDKIEDGKSLSAADKAKVEKWIEYGLVVENTDSLTKMRKRELFYALQEARYSLAFGIERKYGSILPAVKSGIPIYFKAGRAGIANGFMERMQTRIGGFLQYLDKKEERAYIEVVLYQEVLFDMTLMKAQVEQIKNRLNYLLINNKKIKKLLDKKLEAYSFLKVEPNGLFAVEKRDSILNGKSADKDWPEISKDMIIESVDAVDAAGNEHISHTVDISDIEAEQNTLKEQEKSKNKFVELGLVRGLKEMAYENEWKKEDIEDFIDFLENSVYSLLMENDLKNNNEMIKFLKKYAGKLSDENEFKAEYDYLKEIIDQLIRD